MSQVYLSQAYVSQARRVRNDGLPPPRYAAAMNRFPLPRPVSATVVVCLLAALHLMAGCSGGGSAAGVAADGGDGSTSFGAAQLGLLVARGDADSEAIALAYQRARGIPAAHVVRLDLPRGSDVISAADFAAVKAQADAALPPGVQATLLTWTRPSRVLGACAMAITSAFALGYDARHCGACRAPLAVASYNASTRRPYTDLGIRPSMMLGAATLAQAQPLIDRGLAADASLAGSASGSDPAPLPQIFLVRTADAPRSVRYPDFLTLANTGVPGAAVRLIDNASGATSNEVSGQAAVLMMFTGLANFSRLDSNAYLPGAAGDSLTSFAGVLPDGLGQTPVTAWLQAGLTASYGTVEEPCNYPEKFPRASVFAARYRAGETLIEAYWKSVQAPGQGLFVGEPLARPWGAR